PGADESRVAIRSDAHLDRERRRLEADGISDRVLLDDGMGSGSLTLRATRTLFGRLGSATVRRRACAGDRSAHQRLHEAQLAPQARDARARYVLARQLR